MNQKTKLCAVALAAAAFTVTGCSTAHPGAGHQAVLIEHPIVFGHGGIQPEPVTTGLEIIALTTNAVDVDMQPQQFEVKFDDLMSSDGVPLDFDAIVRLQVVDSVSLIKNFGEHWYDTNIEREFANRVRQAVRKHGMNETAINTVAIDAIDKEVTDALTVYIENAHIPVKLLGVTVGKANPPDSIKNQRIETATQEQRVMTEAQKKLAEDARKAAELSRAEADNAYRNAMSLSPDQFLRLEAIKMQQSICGKDGGGHCTFIANGSGATPILDTRK